MHLSPHKTLPDSLSMHRNRTAWHKWYHQFVSRWKLPLTMTAVVMTVFLYIWAQTIPTGYEEHSPPGIPVASDPLISSSVHLAMLQQDVMESSVTHPSTPNQPNGPQEHVDAVKAKTVIGQNSDEAAIKAPKESVSEQDGLDKVDVKPKNEGTPVNSPTPQAPPKELQEHFQNDVTEFHPSSSPMKPAAQNNNPQKPDLAVLRSPPKQAAANQGKENDHLVDASHPPDARATWLSETRGPLAFDRKWDKYAVAVKSGADVAAARLPIQLLTFLKPVRNVALLGEQPGLKVADIDVIDVYTGSLDASMKRVAAAQNSSESDDGNQKAQQRLMRREVMPAPGGQKRVQPDQLSQGWRLDAHKNLPGLRHLYETYPNADWYVMIDDDSYVSMENLDSFLSKRDPSVPLYTGLANVFRGCDGVTRFGDGPYFAHGGSGIVISRGAIEKMMKVVDNCIVKYKDCWAGDVRVGLCMRDAGVLVEFNFGFHKEPPTSDTKYDSDACERPFVFHHLLQSQLQKIHEIESSLLLSVPRQFLRLADLFRKFVVEQDMLLAYASAGGEGPIPTRPPDAGYAFMDEDAPGADFMNKTMTSTTLKGFQECAKLCMEHQRCVSWSLDTKNICWLKDTYVPRLSHNGSWAGYLPLRYSCAK